MAQSVKKKYGLLAGSTEPLSWISFILNPTPASPASSNFYGWQGGAGLCSIFGDVSAA
jgi:hypothetical protein